MEVSQAGPAPTSTRYGTDLRAQRDGGSFLAPVHGVTTSGFDDEVTDTSDDFSVPVPFIEERYPGILKFSSHSRERCGYLSFNALRFLFCRGAPPC